MERILADQQGRFTAKDAKRAKEIKTKTKPKPTTEAQRRGENQSQNHSQTTASRGC
jgi:hypothetical protein